MYAVFEEVVGPQNVTKEKSDKNFTDEAERENGLQSKVMKAPSCVTTPGKSHNDPESETATDEGIDEETTCHYVPCGSLSEVSRKRHKHKKTSQQYPIGSQYHLKRLKDGSMPNGEASTNPLLDTIKVITYDPCDDSDDYCDLGSDYEVRLGSKDGKSQSLDVPQSEGDRESIGYAGSNSIDSGYKSFCPTPEMPDPSAYSPNLNQADSLEPLYGTGRVRDYPKAKFTAGSKFGTRQGLPSARDSPSRRIDPNLYEVNLDHLMYLRQSLLSAIKKCESSSSKNSSDSGPPKPHRRDVADNNSRRTTRQSSEDFTSGNPAPPYQKTVRFNSDVKVTPLHGDKREPDSDPSTNPLTLSKRKDKDQPQAQSKSILKDPLCENLRSKLLTESSDSTLEEEIDSLLYGRAEFYDLESVDDFPCSYVTMIEEKYRSDKPSLAKVRKLKGTKGSDLSKVSPEAEYKPAPESPGVGTNSEEPIVRTTMSSSTRCRFTEVARCMIEIIEDLQLNKLQTDPSAKEPASSPRRPPEQTDANAEPDSIYGSGVRDEKCYASASDYHVYEEIAYDVMGDKKSPADTPPPLPARPTSMLQKLDPKTDLVKRRGRSVRPKEEGSVRNRPKQRSNLYSLFSDQSERRNISRSLERESRIYDKSRSGDQDDEYGFRKAFPSI